MNKINKITEICNSIFGDKVKTYEIKDDETDKNSVYSDLICVILLNGGLSAENGLEIRIKKEYEGFNRVKVYVHNTEETNPPFKVLFRGALQAILNNKKDFSQCLKNYIKK